MIEYLGLWVLFALSLNMWALLSVLPAKATWVSKSVWTALLIVLPGLGFFIWYLLGPRRPV